MIFKNIFVYPRYPENLSKLYNLAYNLWCTWNYEAVNLFFRIDAQLFRAVNHNPVTLLLSLPKERIAELSGDEGFLFELDRVWEKFRDYMEHDKSASDSDQSECGQKDVIVYFAMEFGLHECIPISAGLWIP